MTHFHALEQNLPSFLTKRYSIQKKSTANLPFSLFEIKHCSGFEIHYVPRENVKERYFSFLVPYGALHTKGRSFFSQDREEKFSYPQGIAHFLEHLIFESENQQALSKQLCLLGFQSNAYTSQDHTLYFARGVSKQEENVNKAVLSFATALWQANFTKEQVEKERQVILSELGMQEDDKEAQAFQQLFQNLYSHHAFREEILGRKEDILQISKKQLEDFYQRFYQASKMVLFMVGKFELFPLLESLDKLLTLFEKQEKTSEIFDYGEKDEPDIAKKSTEFVSHTEQAYFFLAGKDVALKQLYQDFKAGKKTRRDLLRHRLLQEENLEFFFGDQSKLFHQFYFEDLINEHFTFAYTSYEGTGHFVFASPSTKAEETLQKFQACLKNLPRESQEEEAKLFSLLRKGRMGRLLQDTDTVAFVAELLLQARLAEVDFSIFWEEYFELPFSVDDFLLMLQSQERQSSLVLTSCKTTEETKQ